MRLRSPRLAALALICAALAARADEARPVLLALKQGTLTYTVVHKLHQVKGISHEMEGLAKVQPGAPAQVQVRARVATFDSGNSNRDSHMRESTGEPVHPTVEVKGTLPPISLPLAGPQDLTMDARVEMNGVQQQIQVPVRLVPQGARAVRGKFSFPISLDAFHVERPELLLIKIDDRATIDGDLLFEVKE